METKEKSQNKKELEIIDLTANESPKKELYISIDSQESKELRAQGQKLRKMNGNQSMEKVKKKIKKNSQNGKKNGSVQKCFQCNKKSGGTLMKCRNCQKQIHENCLRVSKEKLPKCFLCEKCRIKINKQKKLQKAKKQKKTTAAQKPLRVSNSNSDDCQVIIVEKKPSAAAKKLKIMQAKQRNFNEFARKFPEYISCGKVQYPIEDKILQVYGHLLYEEKQVIYKPTPKQSIIPSNVLGDILQIWNFFKTFGEYINGPEFSKEELYVSLNQEGDIGQDFMNEVIYSLVYVLFLEILNASYVDSLILSRENELSFFMIIRTQEENPEFEDGLLPVIWPEVLLQITRIPEFQKISQEIQKDIERICEHSYKQFSSIKILNKIKIIKTILNLIYESETFCNYMNEKIEQVQILKKEQQDLINELKEKEHELMETNKKIVEFEDKISENFDMQQSRVECLRKQKENEQQKRELKNLQINSQKLDQQLQIKRKNLQKIAIELPFFINSVQLIGRDVNKLQYWFFSHENDKIFIYFPPTDEDEQDRWYFLDEEKEINQLLEALNRKGVREQQLHESLYNLIKNQHLNIQEPRNEASAPTQEKEEKITQILQQILDFKNIGQNSQKMTRNKKKIEFVQKQNLSLETIKEIIANIEYMYSDYLMGRNWRWKTQKKIQKFKEKLELAFNVEEIKKLLLYLNENFSIVEEVDFSCNLARLNHAPVQKLKKKKVKILDDSDEEHQISSHHENQNQNWNMDMNQNVVVRNQEKFQVSTQDNQLNADLQVELEKTENLTEKLDSLFNSFEQEEDVRRSEANSTNRDKQYEEDITVKRKIYLKIWGNFNEKLKQAWIYYTKHEVRNLTQLFTATVVFSETISKYLKRKSQEKNSNKPKHNNNQNCTNSNNENHAQSLQTTKQGNKKLVKDSEKVYLDQNEYNHPRKSERNCNNKSKHQFESLNEQQWDCECKICGEFGEMICCDSCPSVFHQRCLNLKQIPEGEWNCYQCLEKITASRFTRNSLRKFNY